MPSRDPIPDRPWPQRPCIVPNEFPARWRCARHRHEFHELVLVVAGGLETDIAGVVLRAGPGDAVLHPAGIPHAERALGPGRLITLYSSWREHEASADGLPLQAPDRRGHMATAMRWGVELSAAERRGAGEALVGLLRAVLHEHGTTAQPDFALVERVRRHAQPRLGGRLRLAELAAAVGMGRSRFACAFRAAAGEAPMAFVRGLRIDAARHLLATTTLTIGAIAERVGFADRFHLSRLFKDITGQPPSFVRRRR